MSIAISFTDAEQAEIDRFCAKYGSDTLSPFCLAAIVLDKIGDCFVGCFQRIKGFEVVPIPPGIVMDKNDVGATADQFVPKGNRFLFGFPCLGAKAVLTAIAVKGIVVCLPLDGWFFSANGAG